MLVRAPVDPTVIRRDKPKGRPSFHAISAGQGIALDDQPSSSATPTNSQSSKNSSGKCANDSTGKTSLDSKFQASSSGKANHKTSSSEKKHQPANQVDDRSSPDSTLTTIQETIADPISPSVETVERAAAAKIYLETYFNEKFCGSSPRERRAQMLEAELFSRRESLAPTEVEVLRREFRRYETEHLRETRAMKARSIRALHAENGSRASCLMEDYELIKILGKGSFGIVRLVRERQPPGSDGAGNATNGESNVERKQVYAMKVIRKSDMLRTSQEGHLRAERDLLVASEGSKWSVVSPSLRCFLGS